MSFFPGNTAKYYAVQSGNLDIKEIVEKAPAMASWDIGKIVYFFSNLYYLSFSYVIQNTVDSISFMFLFFFHM